MNAAGWDNAAISAYALFNFYNWQFWARRPFLLMSIGILQRPTIHHHLLKLFLSYQRTRVDISRSGNIGPKPLTHCKVIFAAALVWPVFYGYGWIAQGEARTMRTLAQRRAPTRTRYRAFSTWLFVRRIEPRQSFVAIMTLAHCRATYSES